MLKCQSYFGQKHYFTCLTLLLKFCVLKLRQREVKIKFEMLDSSVQDDLKSLEKHMSDLTDNCDVYPVMNNGAYCYNCPMWYTLIIVWTAEGREAGAVMTAPLSWQLSLPQWKRLQSTVKNASEIYRPALGLRISGGETWMVPWGRGPSLRLCG